MTVREIAIATRSDHKLGEIRRILAPWPGLRPVGLHELGIEEVPEEEGIEAFTTFEENALAKARYFAPLTRLPTLADDSGLCVDALGGAPGVFSKRFSGRSDLRGAALDGANNAELLRRLEGIPADARTGRYVCVVALVLPDGAEQLFRGECGGVILEAPRGAGGFGYDPLFYMEEEGRTFGELEADRKNELSHRGEAIRAAGAWLARGLDQTAAGQ